MRGALCVSKGVGSAGMVKLVDTPGLGPGASCHAGSSPAARKGNFCRISLKGVCIRFFSCF